MLPENMKCLLKPAGDSRGKACGSESVELTSTGEWPMDCKKPQEPVGQQDLGWPQSFVTLVTKGTMSGF